MGEHGLRPEHIRLERIEVWFGEGGQTPFPAVGIATTLPIESDAGRMNQAPDGSSAAFVVGSPIARIPAQKFPRPIGVRQTIRIGIVTYGLVEYCDKIRTTTAL